MGTWQNSFPPDKLLCKNKQIKMGGGQKLGFAENFMLSGVAAAVSKTAAAPIERVKLLVQNQGEMLKQGTLTEPYKGVLDCTARTMKSEGLVSFWRGNMSNVIRYFPTQALNFAFKDTVKALFKTAKDAPQYEKFAKNILSGGCAGSMSLFFIYRGMYFGLYDSIKPIVLGDNASVFLSFIL